MTPLGWTHTAAALLALAAGAAVLLVRKGTTRHRRLGWAYTVAMVALNGTALFIYRLFGGFGPFHAFAIASLVTVLLGTAAAVRLRRHRRAGHLEQSAKALEHHYAWMTWSYVGLVAAAVSEVATRVPAFQPQADKGMAFAVVVAVATLSVVAVGGRLIRTRKVELLAPHLSPQIRSPDAAAQAAASGGNPTPIHSKW